QPCFCPPPHFFPLQNSARTEIYTLSLHDALPISVEGYPITGRAGEQGVPGDREEVGEPAGLSSIESDAWPPHAVPGGIALDPLRSEEHTSELQSRENLVCRLLLEKKKNTEEKTYI